MIRPLARLMTAAALLALAAAANGQTFSNSAPITINDAAAATPYPSTIGVAGPIGDIAGITVTLTGFSHTYPEDCVFLLVAPDGRAFSLSSRCGGSFDVSNITLSFSPDATASLSGGLITPGTFQPSSCFPSSNLQAPAPPAPYSTDLTALFGTSPEGNWSLYVADQAGADFGQISGGWSISFDAPLPASPSSTSAFTYQGRLNDTNGPVQGDVQLRYRLYDAQTGGTQIGPARVSTEAAVDGIFSTLLDFGPTAFTGGATRWLELSVGGTVLTPRQPVTGTPLAQEARHALAADSATNSNNTRGIDVTADGRVGINGSAVAGALLNVTGGLRSEVDQQQTTSVTTPFNVNIWQSFTAGVTGGFTGVAIRNGVGQGWSATLSIYAGTGTGGTLLASQPVVVPNGNFPPAITINNPPMLTAGQVYTFSFSNAVGANPIRCDAGTNVYAGGVCSVSNIFDLWFQTYMSRPGSILYTGSNGRVGINTAAPTQALEVAGNILANNVAVPSSIRFKDRVYPLDDALANLLKLSGVRFDWKPEYAAQRGFTHDLGFVAEDVEKVFPEVVMHDAAGNVTGMDYSRLTAVAVQAIKQQQAVIDSLKAESARRDAENAELKARLDRLERTLTRDGR